jgi:hypothetical protein
MTLSCPKSTCWEFVYTPSCWRTVSGPKPFRSFYICLLNLKRLCQAECLLADDKFKCRPSFLCVYRPIFISCTVAQLYCGGRYVPLIFCLIPGKSGAVGLRSKNFSEEYRHTANGTPAVNC